LFGLRKVRRRELERQEILKPLVWSNWGEKMQGRKMRENF
jgi:hypothetical protein